MAHDLYLEKMRRDWDERARRNAKHYIANSRADWQDDSFFQSGEQTVAEDILTDMSNVCQGRQPEQMRVLEIGCGAGRVTRALGQVFGEVHAVDVSGEMVQRARQATAALPHVHVHLGDGQTLAAVPTLPFHCAFSTCVFHHIARREVIESYVREVHRLLVPGALFKFEVQGVTTVRTTPEDTWLGVSFSEAEARDLAERCGFEHRYGQGAGEERYWLWFFKQPPPRTGLMAV